MNSTKFKDSAIFAIIKNNIIISHHRGTHEHKRLLPFNNLL